MCDKKIELLLDTELFLNDQQKEAIRYSIKWFKDKNDMRPIFISGYAGTGKSTTVKYLVKELGLEENEVAFCAFSGMASCVLTRKGTTASTIHQLIYKTIKIQKPNGAISLSFKLKDKSELDPKIKLIIVDEFSMVSEKIMNDLLTFDIKIICLGDIFQLPPVASKPHSLLKKPDILLTDIQRQALDNPIVYVSMLIRENKPLKIGNYGNKVLIVKQEDVKFETLMKWMEHSDQILCGKNRTVCDINKSYRENILQLDTTLPQEGEKVICLKNNWEENIIYNKQEIFLVNGLIGNITSENKIKTRSKVFQTNFKPNFVEKVEFENLDIDMMPFKDGDLSKKGDDVLVKYPKLKHFRGTNVFSTGINYFDFAYAITTHKSQGSEYDKVLYIDEVLNRNIHNNLRYTAVTRAKDMIVIMI